MIEPTRNTSDAVDDPRPDPDSGFLRIFVRRFEDELLLWGDLVESPAEGDEIVEVGGALVFLDAAAASALADRELQARVSEGRAHLRLRDRA